jgi:hypothetical protein
MAVGHGAPRVISAAFIKASGRRPPAERIWSKGQWPTATRGAHLVKRLVADGHPRSASGQKASGRRPPAERIWLNVTIYYNGHTARRFLFFIGINP